MKPCSVGCASKGKSCRSHRPAGERRRLQPGAFSSFSCFLGFRCFVGMRSAKFVRYRVYKACSRCFLLARSFEVSFVTFHLGNDNDVLFILTNVLWRVGKKITGLEVGLRQGAYAPP